MALITLTTDFGNKDGYVGILKGVILSINPTVQIVDIAHEIDPGDIDAAAFIIAQAAPFFPSSTIHVVVVDPGVGSGRKILIVKSNIGFYIAPDNGVLKYIYAKASEVAVYSLNNSRFILTQTSQTFHGRDIFAPVAAHLSCNVSIESFGERIDNYQRGLLPLIEKNSDSIVGEIIYIDRFGNLISNVSAKEFEIIKSFEIDIAGKRIFKLGSAYAHHLKGEVLAIIGSHGFLEIAVRDGNAAQLLGVKKGNKIFVRIQDI